MSDGANISIETAPSKWGDLCQRLHSSIGWIAAQFWATPLLVGAGILWTRLPEKHVWQVGLTLIIPLLLLGAFLVLEAGTMRRLLGSGPERVRLLYGALTLLLWIAVAWAAWAVLDWCDDQTYLWSGYLNSKTFAHLRAKAFNYQHIQLSIATLIWVIRWIVVPGKLIPYAIASVEWGWRLPWLRLNRMLLNWRWWLAVAIAAIVCVALPSHFFAAEPSGSVSHQVWAVSIKLVGAWLFATCGWVLALACAAVLLARIPQPTDGLDRSLFESLRAGKGWILGWAGWTAVSIAFDFTMDALPERVNTSGWVIAPFAITMLIAALVLQVGMINALTWQEEKRVKPLWGELSVLVWMAAAIGLWLLVGLWHHDIAGWIIDWVIVPALLIPFAASSARWGLKLPWRRVLKILFDWRWWVGMIVAVIIGGGLPSLIQAIATGGKVSQSPWVNTSWSDAHDLLANSAWVLLMAWFATLLAKTNSHFQAPEGSPLSEPGDNIRGNA